MVTFPTKYTKIYLNVFRFKQNLVWLFLIAICTNMQNISPKSKKFTDILIFKNFEITRFFCYHDLWKLSDLNQFLRYKGRLLD